MTQTNCPYVKISAAQAQKTQNTSVNFSLVPTAHAQESVVTTQTNDIGSSLSDQLTIPFYLFVGSFFLFVILMSAVYIYHWQKFSLNDPFIKNFTPVFFFGLILLSIPLIFNLFF